MSQILKSQTIQFKKDEMELIQLGMLRESYLDFMRTKTWSCIDAVRQRCHAIGYIVEIYVEIEGPRPHVSIVVSKQNIQGTQPVLFS